MRTLSSTFARIIALSLVLVATAAFVLQGASAQGHNQAILARLASGTTTRRRMFTQRPVALPRTLTTTIITAPMPSIRSIPTTTACLVIR